MKWILLNVKSMENVVVLHITNTKEEMRLFTHALAKAASYDGEMLVVTYGEE